MPRAFSSFRRSAVHAGQGLDQRRLAVVDVAGGADDHGSFQCRQLGDEARLVLRFQAAQVEMVGIVADMADDRLRQGAEGRFECEQGSARLFCARAKDQRGRRQPFDRQGAAADLAAARRDRDRRQRADGGLQRRAAGVRPGRAISARRARQQAQRRQPLGQTIRVAVQAQRRFERRQRRLADAQGALQRVLLDLGDQVLAADDQPGLRAAEQLVAGEGDDVGAGGQRLLRRRLGRQAVARRSRSACRCRDRRRRASRRRGRFRPASARRPQR